MANSEYLGFDAEVLFYNISSIEWDKWMILVLHNSRDVATVIQRENRVVVWGKEQYAHINKGCCKEENVKTS